jgi:transcriptional regulator with GAF, ATPase, and Fis domain
MTAKSLLTALLPLVSDLSRELPEGERYRRLLEAMRALLPCDAAALLRLDGEWLVPLAVDGLSTDTLGRRFKVSEHPRFEACSAVPGRPASPPTATCPTHMTAWSRAWMSIWKSMTAWAARCLSMNVRGAC